jgi:uncharacterized membrane protein
MKDEQIRDALALLMIVSVLAAAAVMFAGLVWFLAAHPEASPGDHLFSGEPKYLENPVYLLNRLLDFGKLGQRHALIMAGVLLLAISPVIRVGFAALAFAAEGDRLYSAVSLLVLAVLVSSFFL